MAEEPVGSSAGRLPSTMIPPPLPIMAGLSDAIPPFSVGPALRLATALVARRGSHVQIMMRIAGSHQLCD